MATWDIKVDERVTGEEITITGEPHVVGEDSANFVFLTEVPRQDAPSSVLIAGMTEVATTPAAGQFRVYYTDRLAGAIEFNGADNTADVAVDYFGTGSSLFARDVNNLAALKLDVDGSMPMTGPLTTTALLIGATIVLTGSRVLQNVTADAAIITSGTIADGRIASNVMRADAANTMSLGQTIALAASGTAALSFKVTADTNARFAVRADGQLAWGTGSAVADALLYRSNVGELRTDTDLVVGGKLTIVGRITASGGIDGSIALRTVTASVTVAVTDEVIWADTTSGDFTITLLPASTFGQSGLTVTNIGGHVLTLAVQGTDKLNGLTSLTLAQFESADLLCDGIGAYIRNTVAVTGGGGLTSVTAADVQGGTFPSGVFIFQGTSLQVTSGSFHVTSGATSFTVDIPATFTKGLFLNSVVHLKAYSVGAALTGSVTVNPVNGYCGRGVLTGNITLVFGGISSGMIWRLVLVQDETGGRTVTLPAGVKVPTGFSIATTANSSVLLDFYHDGTDIRLTNIQQY